MPMSNLSFWKAVSMRVLGGRIVLVEGDLSRCKKRGLYCVMATKETAPKAAFQSRRWVAFFIRPALVCLETGNLGVATKKNDPKATQKNQRAIRDRQPGDDNEKNGPVATKKSRPWAAFSHGQPWFAWGYASR